MTMINEAVSKVLARWAEPGGIPFKGDLISEDGCMCAQGQVLHYGAGWTEDDLRQMDQGEADREVARVAGISRTHAVLLRQVNDGGPGAPSVVLDDPASVLGGQAETVLAFWRHLDRVDGASAAGAVARVAAGIAARVAAGDAAGDAARDAAWGAAAATAWDAAGAGARDVAWDAAGAANEIQGAIVMRERGQPFTFLPMFGFADPEAVLAAEARQGPVRSEDK